MSAPQDWAPFRLCESGKRPPKTRYIHSREGVGDRLRAAAFAEIQALRAFNWAADRFDDASQNLKSDWRGLALAEEKHLNWLLKRLEDIGERVDSRPVSDRLWQSYMGCKSAEEFAVFMAAAEDRGRVAGERFYKEIKAFDPTSAEIFRKIAEEEIEHIELASRHFGKDAFKPRITVN